jgi:hypothetical protein
MTTHKTEATNTTVEYTRSEDGKWIPVNKIVSKQVVIDIKDSE